MKITLYLHPCILLPHLTQSHHKFAKPRMNCLRTTTPNDDFPILKWRACIPPASPAPKKSIPLDGRTRNGSVVQRNLKLRRLDKIRPVRAIMECPSNVKELSLSLNGKGPSWCPIPLHASRLLSQEVPFHTSTRCIIH